MSCLTGVSVQQLRTFNSFEVASHWGQGDNRCCSSFSADVFRADHHLQCNLILCKTLGKLFGHQCDASATAAAATAAVFCQRLVPLVPQHNIWNAAATRTTTATTNGNGSGRERDAAFWRKMQRLQIMWIMRSAGACVCINLAAANIADSMTVTQGIGWWCTRRGGGCGVWSLPHILSNKLHSSV